MMDWLNDRKNLPIIGAITGLIVVAAIAMVYLTVRGPSRPADESVAPPPELRGATAYPQAPQSPTMPPPGAPGTQPYAFPQPTTTGVQPAATPPTVEQGPQTKVSLLPYRQDPFLPFDYKPSKLRPKPRIMLPPIAPLVLLKEQPAKKAREEEVLPPQPQRRMVGVMYNGRVYAILETSGETIVVKPGDIVENGNVRVDAIEPDKIVLSWLRTTKPIPIEVRMSEGTIEETTAGGMETGPTPPPTPSFGVPRGGPRSFPRGRG